MNRERLSVPDELRRCVERIEAAISEYTAGWNNAEARRDLGRIIGDLSAVLPAQREKIASVEGWVDILYSPRKHGGYGGPVRVKSFIRHDCASLRSIADQIEAADREKHNRERV